jgi:hypothetical protein
VANRLNQLFQINPQTYLERTVLFSNGLLSPESQAIMANRLFHHVDIEPLNIRSRARLLPNLHQYFQLGDVPMVSYVVPTEGVALISKNDGQNDLVFIPEFTCCRLLVEDDEGLLRLSVDRGLVAMSTPPEQEPDSRYCDSINYWEYVTDDLVGVIRGTAILFKSPDQPWRFAMQQIVGATGHEVVRTVFSRDLRYPRL